MTTPKTEEELRDELSQAVELAGNEDACAELALSYLSALGLTPAVILEIANGEAVVVPVDLTREMWAAAGTAVVKTRARTGSHDAIVEAVHAAMCETSPFQTKREVTP